MWPTWGPLGSFGPRWAPCWPHEFCYQGRFGWKYGKTILYKKIRQGVLVLVGCNYSSTPQFNDSLAKHGMMFPVMASCLTALSHALDQYCMLLDWALRTYFNGGRVFVFLLQLTNSTQPPPPPVKWPPLRQRYLWMHFREWKVLYFYLKIHWSLFIRV